MEKLKTLKDFESVWFGTGEFKKLSQSIVPKESRDNCLLTIKDLKEEAIKWVKAIRRKVVVQQLIWNTPANSLSRHTAVDEWNKLEHSCPFMDYDYESDSPIELVEWIMLFFNISEDDLKKV
jgi:hypothetical protein